MLEKYVIVLVTLIASIFTFLCLSCFGAAGCIYIQAGQAPPVIERLIDVGAILGLVAFILTVVAYFVHSEL